MPQNPIDDGPNLLAALRNNVDSVSDFIEQTGERGGFTFSSGFARRGTPLSITTTNSWVPMDLSATVQANVDQPWWPGANPSNGVDLFGGSALPYGVTRMLDFTQTWDTSGDADVDDTDIGTSGTRTGTLRFDELDTGTTNSIRFDVTVTPQIANTTLEFAIWFQPKSSLNGANDGSAFALTSAPTFFGTGTVGSSYLVRDTNSMYIASDSDRFAYGAIAVKADNPIIVEPQSILIQNLR